MVKAVPKQLMIDKARVQDVFAERGVMMRIMHPFITQLEYAFQSESRLFFVMEYLPAGDLDALLKRLPDRRSSAPSFVIFVQGGGGVNLHHYGRWQIFPVAKFRGVARAVKMPMAQQTLGP